MEFLNNLLDKFYNEDSLSQNLSISVAGIFGLVFYLKFKDAVLTALICAIIFPLFKTFLRISVVVSNLFRHMEYSKLSYAEKKIIGNYISDQVYILRKDDLDIKNEIDEAVLKTLVIKEILEYSIEKDSDNNNVEYYTIHEKFLNQYTKQSKKEYMDRVMECVAKLEKNNYRPS